MFAAFGASLAGRRIQESQFISSLCNGIDTKKIKKQQYKRAKKEKMTDSVTKAQAKIDILKRRQSVKNEEEKKEKEEELRKELYERERTLAMQQAKARSIEILLKNGKVMKDLENNQLPGQYYQQ